MKKEHILVIRFSAMGDVAMAVPVVYSVATQYPDVRITVLSRAFARPFFEDLAPNVHFMEADIKGEYRGMKGLNALYRRLVAKQFTKVADLHNVLRSEYLRLRFNMGRYRVEHINKHRADRRALVSHYNKVRKQLPSSFENYAEVFAKLGYPLKEISFRSLFPEEGGNLNLLPAAIGPKKSFQQWIGIAPTAAHQGKEYPLPLMHEVLRQLTARHPQARIFLFGRGEQENQYFPQWAQAMPQCTNVGWHLDTMRQELILMAHLDVMLSMDSANMHMASLTGIPVVSVWGATHPMAGFMGWHQSIDNAVQLDMDCRPCSIYGKKPCQYGDYRCLTGIKPETIVDKISVLLTKQMSEL
jgi:ADP-heptose:LPS heptosyltransferase